MSLHLAHAASALVHSPLLGVTLTLGAYQLSRTLSRRARGHSLANPVLVSIVLVSATLLLLHVSYADYLRGARYISFALGAATVALAVPLHRQARHIREMALPVALCLLVGSAVAVTTALAVTAALGGDHRLALTMAPKSVTTPVAIALSESVGGVPELTAVFTILTGVLGAVAAPAVLTLLRVRDERVRGLAIGVCSHGIGTARALEEGPVTGAFSALAMALGALVTTVVLPVVLAVTPW